MSDARAILAGFAAGFAAAWTLICGWLVILRLRASRRRKKEDPQ